MLRRLVRIALAACVLLCVITTAMWIRSYAPRDSVERRVDQKYDDRQRNISDAIYSADGLILWVHKRHRDVGRVLRETVSWRWFHPLTPAEDPEPSRNDLWGAEARYRRSWSGVSTDLSFNRQSLQDHWRADGFYLLVPHGLLLLSFGIFPLAYLFLWARNQRRRLLDRCRSCQFTPIDRRSGVCPVCGTVALPKVTIAKIGLGMTALGSFVLCVASTGAWVRGHWIEDIIHVVVLRRFEWHADLTLSRGYAVCDVRNAGENYQPDGHVIEHETNDTNDITRDPGTSDHVYFDRWGILAFSPAYPGPSLTVQFPLCLPTTLFALLPAAWLMRRRRCPLPKGHCRCGYNLAGNTSGVCPECGIAIPNGTIPQEMPTPISLPFHAD